MLCDTAGIGVLLQPLPTGSPFGHHPRLSIGCPRRGQWMSAQKYSAYYRPHVSYIVLRILSTHRIAYHHHHVSYIVLQILSTHCIAYHRHHIPYMVLKTLSLTASPTTVPTFRI